MRSCIALYFADFLFFHRFSSAAPTATVSVGPSAASTDTPVQSAVDIASHYVGYVGDPNGRGTASLVISCLLTLILCVWSALHLNVPYQGQSRFNSLLVNTRWIIAGVYAPELVVFTAWRQWSSAKLLGNIVKEMRENRLPPSAESQDSFSSASKVSDQANVPEWRLDDIDSQERDQPLLAKDNVNEAPTSIIPASVMIPSNEDSTTAQTSTTYSSPRNPPLLPGHQERKQQERPQLLEGRSPSISSVSAVRSVSHNFQKGKVYQNHHEWTMTHDFFASTGGFVFEIEPDGMCGTEKRNGTKFLPPECPRRLALTARGMALLARCGHLPSIARAEITDKSKANDLAKALVIIQACWMLVQVIGRLIAKLPVTLLEVNTIAHV